MVVVETLPGMLDVALEITTLGFSLPAAVTAFILLLLLLLLVTTMRGAAEGGDNDEFKRGAPDCVIGGDN